MSSVDQWLEEVISEYLIKNKLTYVEPLNCKPALGAGSNFTSDLERVTLNLKDERGQYFEKCFLLKRVREILSTTFLGEWGMYETEIKVYSLVHPLMSKLMGPDWEPLWPQSYGYRNYDRLLLEDLKEKGYTMVDRHTSLDFDHCLLVVTALAQFHALSLIAQDMNILKLSEFECGMLKENEKSWGFFSTCFKAINDVTALQWSEEWNWYKDLLKKISTIFKEELRESVKTTRKTFRVLNHGDPWLANMLFRYNEATNKPEAVKMVDYQMSNYGSFANDLQYFLVSSADPRVREERTEELLKEYQKELENVFRKLGRSVESLPTFDEVKEEMVRMSMYGLLCAAFLLPIRLADLDKLPKPDEKPDTEGKDLKRRVLARAENPVYSDSIKQIVKQLKNSGYFESLKSRYNL